MFRLDMLCFVSLSQIIPAMNSRAISGDELKESDATKTEIWETSTSTQIIIILLYFDHFIVFWAHSAGPVLLYLHHKECVYDLSPSQRERIITKKGNGNDIYFLLFLCYLCMSPMCALSESRSCCVYLWFVCIFHFSYVCLFRICPNFHRLVLGDCRHRIP